MRFFVFYYLDFFIVIIIFILLSTLDKFQAKILFFKLIFYYFLFI